MKTVVITGANGGIGLEFVLHYLKLGCRVYALCRKSNDALNNTDACVVEGVDLTDERSFPLFCEQLRDVEIDILINNAGVFLNEQLGKIEYQTIMDQFLINAIAPLKVTEILLKQLSADAKVAMITSRMGSIADNGSGQYYGYRASKAALNALGVSLAHDLKGRGIWVGLLHPGYVKTKMTGYAGDIEPKASVAGLTAIIDDRASFENTGRFWHSNGEFLPW